MKPWMLAAIFGSPELVTKTFTGNATFPMPSGVARLESLKGKGADGAPAKPGVKVWRLLKYQQNMFSDSSGISWGQINLSSVDEFPSEPSAPPPYKDPKIYYTWGYSEMNYTYEVDSYIKDSSPATTGASATGFGKTFPGGIGQAATQVSYSNVAVTGGQNYTLAIPAGGSITLTYYR